MPKKISNQVYLLKPPIFSVKRRLNYSIYWSFIKFAWVLSLWFRVVRKVKSKSLGECQFLYKKLWAGVVIASWLSTTILIFACQQFAVETLGYDVFLVANGEAALNLIEFMNGPQFHEKISRNLKIASIPVVIISADGNVKEKVQDIGVEEYLEKPIAFPRLHQTTSCQYKAGAWTLSTVIPCHL